MRLRQGGDDLDQAGEAALRVEHPVAEVEPAHQVVDAGRPVRRRAEEDRGVAQDLADPAVGERRRHVALQRPGQESGQRRRAAYDVGGEQRRGRLEAAVEEPAQRHVVGVLGRAEVGVEPVAGAGLQRLEERAVVRAVGPQVHRVGVALEEHPVARVEHGEVQLRGGGGAEQREEVLEDLGHEVPRGAGVEAEAVALDAPDPAAELVVLLQQVDAVPARREERGGREAGDAATDDHDATSGCRARRRTPPGRGAGPGRGCGASRATPAHRPGGDPQLHRGRHPHPRTSDLLGGGPAQPAGELGERRVGGVHRPAAAGRAGAARRAQRRRGRRRCRRGSGRGPRRRTGPRRGRGSRCGAARRGRRRGRARS